MSVAAEVGRWQAERQRIIFHFINGRLSSRCPGSQRTEQTLTVCTCFRLSYGYFHIRISDPKFNIRISGYRLTTLGCTPAAATSSNTTSPGPRSTSVPSGILIHPAVWPQYTGQKFGGGFACFSGRELGPHQTQSHMGRVLPPYQVAF